MSVSGAALDLHWPRWLSAVESVRRPYALMVLWGLVVGLAAALVLLATTPYEWPIMASRSTGMRASLAVLSHGGPLLVGRHGLMGSYYAIALGDDPGSFTYLPLLGHLLGGIDPVVMLRYCYVVLVASLTAIYPLIFYRLTRSLLAGIAAPFMLLVCIRSLGLIDIYWLAAWGMLALLPPLYLLARDWPRFGLLALVAISLAAGWLSSMQGSSGVGIVVTAAIVLLLRRWRWWRVLPALALLAAAYISVNTFVFAAIREHRDQRLGVKAMPDDEMTQHPLWHTAYIGLGYLPNDNGISFKDGSSNARVQHDAPGTPYLSHHYETVIRTAYFSFVRAHPLEVLKQYGAKAVVAVAESRFYLVLMLLTMPAMLLLGTGRRMRRRWALLTLPALVVGFLRTMVAVPGPAYDPGLFGVLGVLAILGLCWMLQQVEMGAREQVSLRFASIMPSTAWSTRTEHPAPLRRITRVSVIYLTALLAVSIGGHFIRSSAEHWQSHPSIVQIGNPTIYHR
jgi:hypothetical protein